MLQPKLTPLNPFSTWQPPDAEFLRALYQGMASAMPINPSDFIGL
jgi:hypothetical protein